MNQNSLRTLPLLFAVALALPCGAEPKPASEGALLITEIMYHPEPVSEAEKADGFAEPDDFEFLELANVGSEAIELKGLEFSKGVEFEFTASRALEPGKRGVLVRSRGAFEKRYGAGQTILGNFKGALKNKGEKIELVNAKGDKICSVEYKDDVPWPKSADGSGFSIVLKNPTKDTDLGDPLNWQASAAVGGSPGQADSAGVGPGEGVLINEVIAHTDLPDVDSVELYNPTDKEVDVSGWFLSDDPKELKKYAIPSGTKIPAKGYVVLQEDTDDDPANNDKLSEKYFGRSFSLSSHGDEIYLSSADKNGVLTGYTHGFDFIANQNGVSFGRYVNSAGKEKFVPQAKLTLGAENSGPREEPVIFSEIHYHAKDDVEEAEFVEIWNRTDKPVPLYDPKYPNNTWQVSGLKFTFPKDQTLAPNEAAVIAHIEPERFRSLFHLPKTAKIFGPFEKALANKGEKLTLLRPDEPDPEENLVPMLTVDVVKYNDRAPWPEAGDGTGPSIERKLGAKFSDDPGAWTSSRKEGGTPGVPPNASDEVKAKSPSSAVTPEVESPPAAPLKKEKKDKKKKKDGDGETSQVLPSSTSDGYVILRAQAGAPSKEDATGEKEKRRSQGIMALFLWGVAFAIFVIILIVLMKSMKNR